MAQASEIEDDAKAPVHVVDYGDIDAVAKLLNENNVHTVISAIQTMLPGAGQAEIHLVKAAAKSAATRRFIASVWGFPLPKCVAIFCCTGDTYRETHLTSGLIHLGASPI